MFSDQIVLSSFFAQRSAIKNYVNDIINTVRVNQKTSPHNNLMFKPDGVRVKWVDNTSWWSSSSYSVSNLVGCWGSSSRCCFCCNIIWVLFWLNYNWLCNLLRSFWHTRLEIRATVWQWNALGLESLLYFWPFWGICFTLPRVCDSLVFAWSLLLHV